MNIFIKRAIEEAAADYPDAAIDLRARYSIVKAAECRNFVDLRAQFPKADDVEGVVIFNIRHNRCRLLTSVKYAREVGGRHIRGSVFIGRLMTHAEYDRWSGFSREARERALWPH